VSLKCRSLPGGDTGEEGLCLLKAQLTPRGGKKKWYFFSLDFFVLVQATNSHTNEVVAVKKMSYSGKQTNEVRWCSQF